MSRPHQSKDQNSLDLILRNQVNTNNSRRTANVDHGREPIRTGLAKAPAEVVHLICRLLCLCSYCEPNRKSLDLSPLNPVRFRDDLDSLSKTCKFVRDVAQPYLFHVFGHNDRNFTRRLDLKFSVQLPHVANQVRRITLNSVCGELSLLNRLTGLQTLDIIATKAGAIGIESQLSFPCLKEFSYGPWLNASSVVPMEDARKDLRAILSAAENLSHLTCQRLQHKASTTPFILLRLPACKITILELHECWLSHKTCKKFLANFVCLENFRFKRTMELHHALGPYADFPEDGPERVADATDMVEGLRPIKNILKRLSLNFGLEHNTEVDIFRPLPPMTDFTALRTLHVTQGELGYDDLKLHRESLSDTLPKSLKRLFIDDFDMDSRHLVLDLAKRALDGQYPNLKSVRLKGLPWPSITGISFLASMQDDLEYDDGGFDSTNTDMQTDCIQPEGEGEDEDDNEAVSEDSDTDSSFDDFMTSDEEWEEVIRRCLNDHVLMSSIAHHVRDDSRMVLYSAFESAPLRKKVRALFSRANVKFECVAVVIEESVDGGVHGVWM